MMDGDVKTAQPRRKQQDISDIVPEIIRNHILPRMLPLDTYVTELQVLIHFANVVGYRLQINLPPKHVLNFAQASIRISTYLA